MSEANAQRGPRSALAIGYSYSYLTKMSVKMGQNGFSAVDFLFSDRLLGLTRRQVDAGEGTADRPAGQLDAGNIEIQNARGLFDDIDLIFT